MSQVAIVIDTSDIPTALLGNQLVAAQAALAKVKQDVASYPNETLSNELPTSHVDSEGTHYTQTTRIAATPKVTIDAVTVSASDLTALTAAEVAADIATALAAVETLTVAGAAAGAVTVSGIAVGDIIVKVFKVTEANPPTSNDLTAEFTVTGTDTINNTAGTSSAGESLVVVWYTPV